MTVPDSLSKRGRGIEEDYFKKKDRELIEKLRQTAAAGQAAQELARKTGLNSPELLKDLADLGFTPETVVLLPLVPVIQVAWAEGGITKAERDIVVRLARSRGISEGSAADTQLTGWMASRPSEDVFTKARRLIAAMMDSGSPETISADDLVVYCESIASASGGILGIGRMSAEERSLLSSIAADLKTRRA